MSLSDNQRADALRQELIFANNTITGLQDSLRFEKSEVGILKNVVNMKNSQLREIERALLGSETYNISAMLRQIEKLQKIVLDEK